MTAMRLRTNATSARIEAFTSLLNSLHLVLRQLQLLRYQTPKIGEQVAG